MLTHYFSFGASQYGNPSATGNVTGVTLTQSGFFGISLTWGFEPAYPTTTPAEYSAACQDTSFGIYLNGRLIQVQPGAIRSTTIIAPNANTHEVDVIAWPSNEPMPDTLYSGLSPRRAHLEWDAVTATDLASYRIYSGASPAPTALYATQSTVAVDGINFDFTSGASAVISGAPDPATASQYNNCTFTLTITDADNGIAALTNDHDAESITLPYSVGQPVVALDGLVIVISEQPDTSDTLDFPVRVLSYYDTGILAAGTHYFRITAVDNAGNESTPTADIPVIITAQPVPVTAFAIAYNVGNDSLTYSVTQSSTGEVVNIYSNYDQSTNTIMDEIYYLSPLLSVTLAPAAVGTGNIFADATLYPPGVYRFVARSVTASGSEDDTTVAQEITLPYAADEPEVISATITQTGATYTLDWIADGTPSTVWNIAWTPNDGTATVDDIPTDAGIGYLGYTTTQTVPGSGLHTFTITAGTAGVPFVLTATFDTTAPATPTGGTGTAY